MRALPTHPANTNERSARMSATMVKRIVGSNGEGLCAGEVIGDSFA
jgi:hypothetical protein